MMCRLFVSSRNVLVPAIVLAVAVTGITLAGQTWSPDLHADIDSEGEAAQAGLRMVRVSYEVDVFGPIAVGELVQEFVNEGDQAVKADYAGQTPVQLRVRSIRAEINGEQLDLKPVAKGKQGSADTALTVEPGQPVTIRTGFQTSLPLSGGHFLLHLPAVTTNDPDPVGVPASIAITVHHDSPLLHAESSTHDIFVSYEGDSSIVETVVETESRDFRFEFSMGIEDTATALGFVGPETDGKHDVVITISPPMVPNHEEIRPKQVLFILDTSGSMGKESKLDYARTALAASLDKLGAEDTFNIAEFDAAFSMYSEEPVVAGEGARNQARSWLGSQRAGGNTKVLAALAATLEQPEPENQHRMIVLLTDGAIQDATESLELLDRAIGDARLFVVGIGEDVNRANVEKLADFGRGIATFVDDPEDIEATVAQLFDSVSEPLAWDIQLDFGTAKVEFIEPRRLPDLYAGRSVTVFARVSGELPLEVTIEASTMDGTRTMIAPLVASGSTLPEAKQRIAPSKKGSRTRQRSSRR